MGLRQALDTCLQRRLLAARCLMMALSSWISVAHAAPPSDGSDTLLAATILQIDGLDVVVDVGNTRISPAQQLTVYREIAVRHPLTGKKLKDRFVIGKLHVVQTGATLSIARATEAPEHPFTVGDHVEFDGPVALSPVQQKPPTAAVTNDQPAPSATAPADEAPLSASARKLQDAEQRALGTTWFATLSKPPEARVQIYTEFLRSYPESRYRPIVAQEIETLRALSEAEFVARAARHTAANTPQLPALVILPITTARVGEAIDLAGLLRAKLTVRSLVLYARPLDQLNYVSYPLETDARGHARVHLPATLARAPGFGYFVEAVDESGRVVSVDGTAQEPRLVVVHPPPAAAVSTEPRTSVRFSSELVSFDGGSGRDFFFVNEGDFLYRLRLGPLYGLRVGYGNYTGRGGTVDQLDRQGLDPQPAGFTYGFVETELAPHRLFGLAARGTVGLGRPNGAAAERNALTGGFALRARIGAAEGTHLVLAGELMPEIGQRAYLGFHFEAIRSLPMAAEVVVTDQPVHSKELAVRLVYEIGYRLTQRFALALRPSYQLRTIAHAGPGLGLAATFDW